MDRASDCLYVLDGAADRAEGCLDELADGVVDEAGGSGVASPINQGGPSIEIFT